MTLEELKPLETLVRATIDKFFSGPFKGIATLTIKMREDIKACYPEYEVDFAWYGGYTFLHLKIKKQFDNHPGFKIGIKLDLQEKERQANETK